MTQFIKRQVVGTLRVRTSKINIFKCVKEGTSRVFFYPETLDGKRLSSTMFARKYDAENLGWNYLYSVTSAPAI